MKLSPTYKMPFKRRRLGKTDYNKRLEMVKSGKPRLVVRKSLKYITAQIVQFDGKGDKTVLSANSRQLKKIGWNFACDNLPAAYLTGLAVGKQSVANKITEAILDAGLYKSTKGSKIYAAAKGAVDAGLKLNLGAEVLPSEDRIKGAHIAAYKEKFKDLPQVFEKIKSQILGV